MNTVVNALWRDETPYLLATVLLLALPLMRGLPASRRTIKHSLLLFAGALLLDAVAALFAVRGQADIAAGVHQAALFGIGIALIRLAGLALFRLALPALRVQVPGIGEDIAVIGGYLLWGMIRLSYAGVELTSLVATSAVITAVVAFAMQDTLGNILGGLALQLDDSLAIGDWVRLDDLSGRVVAIQWRYTALVTRSGERVVVPNAQLMKSRFAVIGAGELGLTGWRRSVGFAVDYAASPSQVMAAAERCVAEAEIANVARTPAPSCVASDFGAGAMHYTLRYWLVDPRDDDPTDSAVRTHLLATLQRNGWRIALPDQAVHLVQQGEAHREAVWQRELARRVKALAGIDLFASLSEEERRHIAGRLVTAPFARGDVITHQGAEAHWLYIIVGGEADVYWQPPQGERRHLAHVTQGHVCGEMGLMTGAVRSATVVASTEVDCYRLDKAGFAEVLNARPAIAETLSHVLAERQQQIDALQDQAKRESADAAGTPGHADILKRIQAFFGLG